MSSFSPLTPYHVEIHRALDRQEGRANSLRPGMQRKKPRVGILAGICLMWPSYLLTLYPNPELTCTVPGPRPHHLATQIPGVVFYSPVDKFRELQSVTNYLAVAMKLWKAKTQKDFTLIKLSNAHAVLHFSTTEHCIRGRFF